MLRDVREEKYARYLAAGLPPYRAYPMAGYRKHNGNCYRKRECERVKRRLEELVEEGFAASDLTPDMIVEALAKEAATAKEGNTRVRALELLGKKEGIWHADKPVQEMTDAELKKAVEHALLTDPALRAAAMEILGNPNQSLADTEAKGTA